MNQLIKYILTMLFVEQPKLHQVCWTLTIKKDSRNYNVELLSYPTWQNKHDNVKIYTGPVFMVTYFLHIINIQPRLLFLLKMYQHIKTNTFLDGNLPAAGPCVSLILALSNFRFLAWLLHCSVYNFHLNQAASENVVITHGIKTNNLFLSALPLDGWQVFTSSSKWPSVGQCGVVSLPVNGSS